MVLAVRDMSAVQQLRHPVQMGDGVIELLLLEGATCRATDGFRQVVEVADSCKRLSTSGDANYDAEMHVAICSLLLRLLLPCCCFCF